jgi:membrane fusion protein
MFRQEAIDFERQHRQGGQVALLQPLPTKIITWLVAVSVGCIIIFLFLGQYARKETVVGFLAPTSGIAKIFATRPGTIKDIYVKEGEEVKKGQPLLAVETSQIAVTGQDINAGTAAPTLRPRCDAGHGSPSRLLLNLLGREPGTRCGSADSLERDYDCI